jgi:predicted ribosomally synthesized six-cysteine peptide SCIFF
MAKNPTTQKSELILKYSEVTEMKNVKTLNKSTYAKKSVNAGCGECQASCQSACKTSCTVANQKCEKKNKK